MSLSLKTPSEPSGTCLGRLFFADGNSHLIALPAQAFQSGDPVGLSQVGAPRQFRFECLCAKCGNQFDLPTEDSPRICGDCRAKAPLDLRPAKPGRDWYRGRAIHWAREARHALFPSERELFGRLAKHYLARLKFLFPVPQP